MAWINGPQAEPQRRWKGDSAGHEDEGLLRLIATRLNRSPKARHLALDDATVTQRISIKHRHQQSTESGQKTCPGMNYRCLFRIEHLVTKQHDLHNQEQSNGTAND